MDYRRYGDTLYIRLDRGDELTDCVLAVCRKEDIRSAVYSGIGGCREAEIQTFDPEKGSFDTEKIEGALEMASVTGNITYDSEKGHSHHTHAVFSVKEGGIHRIYAGHLKSTVILYTAEIELRPVTGGLIGKKHDAETGTEFWRFD